MLPKLLATMPFRLFNIFVFGHSISYFTDLEILQSPPLCWSLFHFLVSVCLAAVLSTVPLTWQAVDFGLSFNANDFKESIVQVFPSDIEVVYGDEGIQVVNASVSWENVLSTTDSLLEVVVPWTWLVIFEERWISPIGVPTAAFVDDVASILIGYPLYTFDDQYSNVVEYTNSSFVLVRPATGAHELNFFKLLTVAKCHLGTDMPHCLGFSR